MTEIEQDAALIKDLGGPTAVSNMLGFKNPGGPNRVANWITRGIPAAVKVKRPDIFLRKNRTTRPQEKAAA